MRRAFLLIGLITVLAAGIGAAAPATAKDSGLRIHPLVRANSAGGTVVVSGRATCPGAGQLAVHAHIRQTTASSDGAAGTLHGDGYATVECASAGSTARWQVDVFNPSGSFVAGGAECFASASLNGDVAGSSGYLETTYVPVRVRADRRA